MPAKTQAKHVPSSDIQAKVAQPPEQVQFRQTLDMPKCAALTQKWKGSVYQPGVPHLQLSMAWGRTAI
jgi:hypothetical protein